MAAPNTYYRGFIKQINSGDTVVIRGKPRGGPPQEQTIILSHITAPKLGRRPIGNDDATIDEPYAWESREFLRKLTVGKEVSYVVEYVIPKSDRKCCLVYLGNGVEGPCINEEMVKAGWAGVRSGQNKNSEEMGKYEGLLAEAVAAGLGIHNEEGREAAVRNVTWTHEDPRALFDELKGKPVAEREGEREGEIKRKREKRDKERRREGEELAADRTLCEIVLLQYSEQFTHCTLLMDRTFSSWENGAPDDDVDVADYRKLEVSIMGTLRLVGGYPDPNKEGGIFEDKRMVHSYLAKLDTTKKTKFIAEMAGILWYRALPLTKHARSMMEKQSNSEQLFEQLEEELSSAKVQIDNAREELLQGHRKISALQDEVSSLKDTVISLKDTMLEKSVNAVQAVVKNEIQSYSTVLETAATAVNQACTTALAPSKIRSAIASASTDRSSNLIVYGLCEDQRSSDSDKVKDLFEYLEEVPVLSKVERLGRSSEERARPVKVVLRSIQLSLSLSSMAAPNTYYRGFIKQINSGDTVVIRGKPRGGPPQEQTIILSHITAPKLGRRPIGNDDATIDEPYAWESREFLRKLTVGKEVSYVVEYVIPKSDRKCCLVYLGNGVEGPCINEEMVKAGWAGVRSGQNKNSEEMGKYEGLLAEAVAAGLGIHNEEGREAAVRNVTWTHEDPRALFDELKGKPVAVLRFTSNNNWDEQRHAHTPQLSLSLSLSPSPPSLSLSLFFSLPLSLSPSLSLTHSSLTLTHPHMAHCFSLCTLTGSVKQRDREKERG
eukprot:sb/3462282/